MPHLSALWTVDRALDQLFTQILQVTGLDEDEAVEYVRKYLKSFTDGYWSSENPQFDYTDPLVRFAYVYVYVGAHANLFARALTRLEGLHWTVSEFLTYSELPLNICTFGGGPGSELLGTFKYIHELAPERVIPVRFILVDKVVYWNETWEALTSNLDEEAEKIHIRQRSFLPLDFTIAAQFSQMASQFRPYWLFVFNYAISEALGKAEAIGETFREIAKTAGEDIKGNGYPIFLFIDRNQPEVVDAIGYIINQAGLIFQKEDTETGNLPPEEQKEYLQKWIERFDWFPKITWNAYMCWATKE